MEKAMSDELLYKLVGSGETQTLTVFGQERPKVANNTHPHWDKLLAGVLANDPEVIRYFDMQAEVQARFARLSDRVTLVGDVVNFDGDPVHNALTMQLMRLVEEDEDNYQPLVNFFELVMQNPNEHSREQLFNFLENHPNGFSIAENGYIVGYKGLYQIDPEEKDGFEFRTYWQGTNPVTVDGVSDTGYVYQNIGSIVEMARSKVSHNPEVGCSYGLHVSTYDYAKSYGNVVVRVLVNPRDVVSVPNEHRAAKIRVCRYVNDEVVAEGYNRAVYYVEDPDTQPLEEDDDQEWCFDHDEWADDCEWQHSEPEEDDETEYPQDADGLNDVPWWARS
jgi:hypothetical protein